MDKKEFDFILQEGEGFKIEFKEGKSGIDKDIVAFSNSEGGRIFLGVNDEGKVFGTHFNNEFRSEIQTIARNCDPTIKVELEQFENILIINVEEGKDKPYKCKEGFYMRIGANSQKMNRNEIIELIQQTNRVKFDKTICPEATLKDIDGNKLKEFVRIAKNERNFDVDPNVPIKEGLTRLNLMIDDKLTNASILLFGKNPQRLFLNSRIRCARFKGIDSLDFIDMKVLDGTIPELRENAVKFVLQHIKHGVYFDSNQRYDKWEYPIRAIEEAITNALAHRDYYSSAEIQLSTYDDRIEIWNPGELLKPLTLEDLKKEHQSIPRNELIADSLFLIKYIEKWGRGTNRIIEEMLRNKLPEPIFMIRAGSFVVKLVGPGKQFEEEIEKEKLHILDINERQKRAIEYIKEKGVISRKNYIEINNVSHTTAHKELKDLVNKKILQGKGSGKYLRYELTQG